MPAEPAPWRLWARAIASVVLTFCVGRPAAAQSFAPEPVIVELRLGNDVAALEGLRVGGDVLLPPAAVLHFAEIALLDTSAARVVARLEPSGDSLVLDLAAGRAQRGARIHPVPTAASDGGAWLASVRALAALLEVPVEVAWGAMTVTLDDVSAVLPRTRRQRRAAQQLALLARRAAAPHGPQRVVMPRAWVGGGVMEYAGQWSGTSVGAGSYGASLGAEVLGGALEGMVTWSGPPAQRHAATDVRWTGTWPDTRWLTTLTVGDGIASGPRPRMQRGLVFTNAPPQRSSVLGVFETTEQFGPGWQVEVYRAGELIAVDSTDALGRTRVPLTVQYGDNLVELVAYGPHGEVRSVPRLIAVPLALLPAGAVEYGASVGACRDVSCWATSTLDVRYGLTSRWTMRAGLEQRWQDSTPALRAPYVELAGLPGDAVGMSAELLASQFLRAQVWVEPTPAVRVRAEVTRFLTPGTSPADTLGAVRSPFAPPGRRMQGTLSGSVRPVAALPWFLLDGALTATVGDARQMTAARLGTWLGGGAVRVYPSLRWQARTEGATRHEERTVAATLLVVPPATASAFLAHTTVRAYADVTRRTAEPAAPWRASLSATVTRQLSRGIRIEAGVHRTPGAGGPVASLGLTADAPWGRAQSTAVHGGGTTTATQLVQGAAYWSPQHARPIPARSPALGRSGLSGTVYVDTNGNGTREPGEPGIAGAMLRVGAMRVEADAAGRYVVWELAPHAPTRVAVDTTSLASPFWVPAAPAWTAVLPANRVQSLDLPIVPGGLVEGRVLRADGPAVPVAGVQVWLVPRDGGAPVSVTTFSDGTFSAVGIRPGAYEAAVDADGPWTAAPVAFVVHPSTGSDGGMTDGAVATPTLRVTPAPRDVSAP